MSTARISEIIASEISALPRQVVAATELLDGGATVPFIARYRKEVTGGLDDTQLRRLEERLVALQEAFQVLEQKFAGVVKVARTQMQDAVLTTLGREMGAYAEAVGRDRGLEGGGDLGFGVLPQDVEGAHDRGRFTRRQRQIESAQAKVEAGLPARFGRGDALRVDLNADHAQVGIEAA